LKTILVGSRLGLENLALVSSTRDALTTTYSGLENIIIIILSIKNEELKQKQKREEQCCSGQHFSASIECWRFFNRN
jgi:hypothetical protein